MFLFPKKQIGTIVSLPLQFFPSFWEGKVQKSFEKFGVKNSLVLVIIGEEANSL
ncbi:hypothetical protein IC575_029793 [Cucumis melo]